MTGKSSSPRRRVFAASAALGIALLAGQGMPASAGDTAFRPFRVHVSDAALADLRRRIAETRWPDKETVADRLARRSTRQGPGARPLLGHRLRLAQGRGSAERAAHVHDRDRRARHSFHSRELPSPECLAAHHHTRLARLGHRAAGVIDPLTNPTAHGGQAEDAFDVVIPSMPGYGFSGKPTDMGWNPDRIARAWAELMKRLGYTRYVAQGGDWGAPVSSAMARQAPAGIARHPYQSASDGAARHCRNSGQRRAGAGGHFPRRRARRSSRSTRSTRNTGPTAR